MSFQDFFTNELEVDFLSDLLILNIFFVDSEPCHPGINWPTLPTYTLLLNYQQLIFFLKECHRGDYGSCMLEVTEHHGQMRTICMGCKQDGACQNAMAENFWDFLPANVAAARYARPDPYDRFTKCKPEDSYNQIDRSYCR